jgi:hypothetical protein
VSDKIPIIKFNSGEISPELWWRSDIDKYMGSSRRLENFIVQPQGSIKRRFGSRVIARLGDKGEFVDARIIPWVITRDDYFQLIFTPGGILSIYSRLGVLVDSLTHPYSAIELAQMDFQQVFDVMYIAHENHPLQDLSRPSQFTFSLSDHLFAGGPFNTQNVDTSQTLGLTVTANQDEFTLDYVGATPPFVSTDVGRLVKILYDANRSLTDKFDFDSTGVSSASLPGFGAVTMRTEGGIWGGKLDLEKSVDGGVTWQVIGTVQSNTDATDQRNGELTRDVEEFNALVRVTMSVSGNPTDESGCVWYLEVSNDQFNYVEISQFNSSSQVLATLVAGEWANTAATYNYSLGAFSETTGYPRTVTVFEERLMLGGTKSKPATIYGSQTNNWEAFAAGTFETSPIIFSLSSDTRNTINWLVPEKQLIIGTDSSEWTIGTRDNDKVLSGSNVTARRHSQYGSAQTQPVQAGDMTLYIESGGKRLRTSSYSFQDDGYISDDMNLLARQITETVDLMELAYTRTPDKLVWAILTDGSLASFTFERAHNVLAWARHPMPGATILSIDSVIGPSNDEVGLIVERSDGIYYEVINSTNLCLDWQQQFTVESFKEIVTLAGEEDDLLYHDHLLRREEAPFIGIGSFIRPIAPLTTPIIKYAGLPMTEGDDYLKFSDTLFWVDKIPNPDLLTLFDGFTEILTHDKFKGEHSFTITVNTNNVTMSTAVIKYNAGTLTRDVDFYEMSGVGQFLIIGQEGLNINLYTVEDGAASPLPVDDWKIQVPRVMVSIDGEDEPEFTIGLAEESFIEINDPAPMQGPGMRRNTPEVEIYLHNAIGGEISTNGNDFDDIFMIAVNIVPSSLIEPFTGKKRLAVNHGYSNDEEDSIMIRNNSVHGMTICALSLLGRVTGKK